MPILLHISQSFLHSESASMQINILFEQLVYGSYELRSACMDISMYSYFP